MFPLLRRRWSSLPVDSRRGLSEPGSSSKEASMVARIAGSMTISVALLIVVSFLVSFGVLWWSGIVVTSALLGTIGGLAAVFAMDALHTAVGRTGDRLSDENDRSSSDSIAEHDGPMKQ
jgi:hypothetical protein